MRKETFREDEGLRSRELGTKRVVAARDNDAAVSMRLRIQSLHTVAGSDALARRTSTWTLSTVTWES
jgi:hypothetical protein